MVTCVFKMGLIVTKTLEHSNRSEIDIYICPLCWEPWVMEELVGRRQVSIHGASWQDTVLFEASLTLIGFSRL